MPTERRPGETDAAAVPDAEYYVLLDSSLAVTATARERRDPSVSDADGGDGRPGLLTFERGESLPEWVVNSGTWASNRIAALTAEGRRVDAPDEFEQGEDVRAPRTLAHFRDSQGLPTPGWEVESGSGSGAEGEAEAGAETGMRGG